VFQPRDREVLADKAVIVAGPHVEDADVLARKLAGRFRAEQDFLLVAAIAEADAAAEERVDDQIRAEVRVVLAVVPAGARARAREVEEGRAVEEEIAFLRIEQREARQVHLALVDLRLREVGIDRQVRAERRRRVVEEVNTCLAGSRRSFVARGRILRAAEDVRLDVEPVSLGDVGEAGHASGVGHPVEALVTRPARPDAVFVSARERARDVDAPRVAVRVEVERAERDLNLEAPRVFAAMHAEVPDAVPLAILAVDAEQRVGQRAGGICFEEISGASIEERIDRPLHLVVLLQRLVASLLVARQARGGLGVVADDAEIDRLRVERDAHFRLLGGGRAVVGIDLDEVGRHLRTLPDRFVEVAVERDDLALRDALGGNDAPCLRGRWDQLLGEGDGRDEQRAEEQADQSCHTEQSECHVGLGSNNCKAAGADQTARRRVGTVGLR
jgi:hypothetical protein